MATLLRRYLGDLDAAKDSSFANHFVESPDLLRISTRQSDIIYGTKGVGKTALRRALTELNSSTYYATTTIDLDPINFAQVHEALSGLKKASKTEVATLARNTWRNVLSMYCLEVVAKNLPNTHPLRQSIESFLDDEGASSSEITNNRLLASIERLFNLVAQAGLEREKNTLSPLGLTKRQLSLINEFPCNPILKLLLERCSTLIGESGKVALVCLDGFDSIVDHTPESRKAIFAGLIDAIYKCSTDALFKSFCFKAFLPRELTEEAQTLLWDNDKFINNTHYLGWSEKAFQDLLTKRLRPFARTKSGVFGDLWRDVMPDKVKNSSHTIEEPSFAYILRHTLYRPRQVLTHLQRIFDSWDETHQSHRIDPSFVPPVVAKTNYELARSAVGQIQIMHPGLADFLKSWSGSANTIFVGDFQERIRKIFNCQTPPRIGDIFDSLFNLGIFGIAKAATIKSAQRTGAFRFAYVDDRFATTVYNSVDPYDVVALSPMLHEYCGCTSSEFGVVLPSQ